MFALAFWEFIMRSEKRSKDYSRLSCVLDKCGDDRPSEEDHLNKESLKVWLSTNTVAIIICIKTAIVLRYYGARIFSHLCLLLILSVTNIY